MCFYGKFKKTDCNHQWETWVLCADTKPVVNNKGNENIKSPFKLCKELEESPYNYGYEKMSEIEIPGTLVSEKYSNIWCPKCHLTDERLEHGWVCCVCSHHNKQPLVFCQNIECFAQRIHGSSRHALATSHVLCKGCTPGTAGLYFFPSLA